MIVKAVLETHSILSNVMIEIQNSLFFNFFFNSA